MNYIHYEDKIVEDLEVELIGWPLPGPICNPGTLRSHDAVILRDVLADNRCKWIELTKQQVADRKARNAERVANGEQVYGPPRKKRSRKDSAVDGENNGDDNNDMEMD
jgi:hypothetical protein